MKLYVITEARFRLNTDSIICSDTGGRGYSFWQRYLDVFETVTIVGRLFTDNGAATVQVEGKGVSFFPLPGYDGPQGYLFNFKRLTNRLQTISLNQASFIGRVPSPITNIVIQTLIKRSWPYALEVVGDPYDTFTPGATNHPLRPFFQWLSTRQLKYQCKNAAAAAYVTEHALQHRYPPPTNSLTSHYSSIELSSSDFASNPRTYTKNDAPLIIVMVGMMGHLYKAQDILIEALALCVQYSLDIELRLIGSGCYREQLESQAASLGLTKHIKFMGLIPSGKAVQKQLDRADLFVLPSRQEGLPRALIEAMSRGLPCIGSTVGGIPELLPQEDMVPPNEVLALAKKIHEIAIDPARMTRMSIRNLNKAQKYRDSILRQRRIEFYKYIKKVTEKRMHSL